MSDDVINQLTLDEARAFLSNVLEMTSPESKLQSDPESFLNELIVAWLHHIPFQTIKEISVPHHERHLPSIPEIKSDMFSRLGGVCYDHSVFCYLLLKTLGFCVSLTPCDVSYTDSHAISIVHNLTKEGSRHIVDVGTGYPTFRAIPMDFEQVSPEYTDSFLRYRYIYEGDLIIRQHHVDTDPRAALWPDRVKDGWYYFIYIHHKTQVSIPYFDVAMTRIYKELLPSPPYLSSPRCMAWPNKQFVCIKDTTLLLETVPGTVKKSYLKSRDDILAEFSKYFPQVPLDSVGVALRDENVKLDFTKGQN
ncbi:uncharacterized protein [Diadema antillarum]|uniref:uncharacterized protein n=1 Tax=Diadema antillarum TaxID=105358 RepID=UPI003A8579B3